MLSPRERVRLALAHQETDRVPVSTGFGMTEPVARDLAEHLGLSGSQEAMEYLEGYADIRKVRPEYVGPECRQFDDGSWEDEWGVIRTPQYYGDHEGYYDEISHYPLADMEDVSELDDYRWPEVDWWDMESVSRQIAEIKKEDDFAIQVGMGNIFERSWYMRGLEQMMMDLVLNPEFAYALMERVSGIVTGYLEAMLKTAEEEIDIVFTADDVGGQQGLLFSLDLLEKYIKPHHEKMNEVLHNYDVRVMYHTDGAVMPAVPSLIEMGIDILEALQFDAQGMDPVLLKERFGDRLSFHGGISVQKTLPHGTVSDVKREVRERISVLGAGGGYILAPAHAIQAGTPVENVLVMFETALNKTG